MLEEQIGDVVCVARRRKGQALAAYFELPKLPERLGAAAAVESGNRRRPRA